MTNPRSIIDIYNSAALLHPHKKAFFYAEPWQTQVNFNESITFQQIWLTGSKFADDLKKNGVKPNDKIGIWMPCSWKWEVSQLAVLLCNAVVVGIDPRESSNNYSHIEDLVDLKFMIYEAENLPSKWSASHNSKVQFLQCNVKIVAKVHLPVDRVLDADLEAGGFIFLTSGTTSKPKAIAYDNARMIFTVQQLVTLYPEAYVNIRTVCWLPLSSPFQRVSNFSTLYCRGEIYFLDNPVNILPALRHAEPNIFIAVPRFFEKIYEGFLAQLNQHNFPVKSIVLGAVKLQKFRSQLSKSSLLFRLLGIILWPVSKIVFAKIKSLFGNNIKILVSGSAPLKKEISIMFYAAGLPISEAYGVSENLVPIASLRYKEFKPGSVGRPVLENSVKISSQGEILVKGQGLFSGYIKQVVEDIFIDGYYKTGDLGYLDESGYLYLTGRLTSVFKTDTGKKVPVTEIEEKFEELQFVDQAIVLGEGRKIPMVLLTTELPALADFLKNPKVKKNDFLTASISPEESQKIKNAIMETLASFDSSTDSSTAPAGAVLLLRQLSVEFNEVTPNFKLRRKHIEDKFSNQVSSIYIRIENKEKIPVLIIDSSGRELTF